MRLKSTIQASLLILMPYAAPAQSRYPIIIMPIALPEEMRYA
jgi:hypothetical protein